MVEEAKQRRKKLKLTQQRLALLANVSTPTISRFESGEKDIQWSSIHRILSCLGLSNESRLAFPDPQPVYHRGRGVEFWGHDGDIKIQCSISEEALQDRFNSDGEDSFKIFKKHQKSIEQRTWRKYLYAKDGRSTTVSITNEDF